MQPATGMQKAGCHVALVLAQHFQLVVAVLMSSMLTMQLAFYQQQQIQAIWMNCLSLKEWQQLVQRQSTAICNSVQATVPAFHLHLIICEPTQNVD